MVGGAARVQSGAQLRKGPRGALSIRGTRRRPGPRGRRVPASVVTAQAAGRGGSSARCHRPSPRAAPSSRPALSLLPPYRPLPDPSLPRLPRGAPGALGARRGPQGRGGQPWVRVRELRPAKGPKFARGSGRRRRSPGRSPAFPHPRPGPAGSRGNASRGPVNSKAGTPRRQLEVGTLRSAALRGIAEPLTGPRTR